MEDGPCVRVYGSWLGGWHGRLDLKMVAED